MKTDTEDPNIATLRDYVRQGSVNGTTEQQDEEALRALQDLASKLAERDRRIAELRRDLKAANAVAAGCALVADTATERIRALEAPPAPAPGELEEALAAFAAVKDNFEAAWRPGAQRMTLRWTTDWETHEGAYFGQTPHAVSGDGSDYHTALAAALSRARGEGT